MARNRRFGEILKTALFTIFNSHVESKKLTVELINKVAEEHGSDLDPKNWEKKFDAASRELEQLLMQ